MCVRIEGLDRVDALVEQVEAKRQPCAHREHVEQAAADRELAGGDHLRDVLVTGQHELRAQAFREQAFALAEEERVAGDVAGGRKPLQRGRRRHDQDVERSVGRTLVVVRQAIQGLETLRHQILVRRQDVVGQGFPVRKRAHRQLGGEPGDLLDEALRVECIRAHDDREPAASAQVLGVAGQQQRIARAWRPRDGVALPCRKARHRELDLLLYRCIHKTRRGDR